MAGPCLKLYVVGGSPRSQTAIEHARRLCAEFPGGPAQLAVIDLTLAGGAQEERPAIVAPTLAWDGPAGEARVFGDLSDPVRVIAALGLGRAR